MNFVEDVLGRLQSSRRALVCVDRAGERREWTFGELLASSTGVARALLARGVARGDVVITLAGNRVEWVVAMLACFRIGAVALPCNTQLRRKDLELRFRSAQPRLVIGEEDLLGELPAGAAWMTITEVASAFEADPGAGPDHPAIALDPGDPALIVFTSGTTAEPLGVVHAQRYLSGQALQAEHWLGATPGDLVWCTASTGWSKSARNSFIAPWLRGAAALLVDGRFDATERLETCEREGVTVLCQAPTEYRMLAKRTELRPVAGLRRMVSAGEALDPGVIAAFRKSTGVQIHDGYGQTETGALTGMRPGDQGRDGSMGRPLPGIETRLVASVGAGGDQPQSAGFGDHDHAPRASSPGEAEAVGELQVRPDSTPTFFSRYLDGKRFEGKWWPTGDLVRRDADGYLWHQGRSDDLILSAGYRIGPIEVESALLSHPAIAEAAAVASPDPERGSVVRAIVVLRHGQPSDALARELQEHVKAVTAPYKYPRIIEFADSLPKTASGKIRRAQLRDSP